MPMTHRRRVLFALALSALALPFGARATENWPSRAIRIIVPYPAGGGPDISVRKLAEILGRRLGVPVIVDNKPGASALLGTQVAAASAPDGYTVAYITSGLVTVEAMTHKIDLSKVLQPVAKVNASAFVAVVPANSKYHTLQELIGAAKAHPGSLSYGSAGVGSPAHMAVEYMKRSVAGLEFLHVPYKGAVESINAMRSGQIDFSIMVLSSALPQVKAGSLRALAVTTPTRVPQLAGTPTFVEAGVPRYGFSSWGGFALPAGTSPAITQKLFAAIQAAAHDPGFRSIQESLGSVADVSGSPDQFRAELNDAVRAEESVVRTIVQQ